MATVLEKLNQARAAYHALQLGEALVELRDSNGEQVIYNRAKLPQLAAYINELERQILGLKRPNAIQFTTSKGLSNA